MTHLRLDLNVEELALLHELLRSELDSQRRGKQPARHPALPQEPRHHREVLAGLADRVAWLSNADIPV